MKNFFYALITVLFISTTSSAQAPQIQWQKCLGGSNYEFGYDVRQTSDNGFIVAGCNGSSGYGGFDAWLVKLSADGTTQWQKRLGGSDADIALSVEQTFDGGYIVACNTNSADTDVTFNHGGSDIWLVKLSPTGTILWQRTYGGAGDEGVMSIRQAPDSGFIIAGFTTSSDGDVTLNKGANDIWVIKVDSIGSIQWQKTYGGALNDYSSSIQLLNNGYILAGYTASSNGDVAVNRGNDDLWVLRLSDTGSIVWQKTFGGTLYDFAEDVIVTTDSGFAIVGGTSSIDGDVVDHKDHGDAWVVKLTDSGVLQWQKCLGSYEDDAATSIRQTLDGGYMLSGWVGAESGDVNGFHGANDYWLAKLTATGTITWGKSLGSLGVDIPRGMQLTSDGGYIMAGYTFNNSGDVTDFHGGSDIWVVKLNESTSIPQTAVSNITCAPNPATDKIRIIGAADVNISVYSISGQLLRQAGHTDEISISDLPVGIYTVTVASEGVIVYTASIEKR